MRHISRENRTETTPRTTKLTEEEKVLINQKMAARLALGKGPTKPKRNPYTTKKNYRKIGA